ncbi:RT0821/Lpp0805 family surface protein [Oleispirillum naphthae]|uniref:RT0821/Lpp0805 family surface protein n=1 Tax=Oleispirillum naphthae TaxID=2838853 RepID=UPI0030822748
MRAGSYLTLAVCVIGLAATDAAQAHPPGPPGGYHGPGRTLVPDGWHRGHWRHDWHDGRFGWWWAVGPAWYYYPAPIYPYPNPYAPPSVVAAPAGQYAYYCANPAGYYPAVAQCLMSWQLVSLAAPAPAAVMPVPSLPPAIPAPVPAPSSSGGVDKTTGGTVLGAVGGAVAGAQFGQGSGRIAAAALGTLLGAFVGHEVGQSLDRADTLAAQQAAQRAYIAPIGQTITWNTPETNHGGTITPVREGRDAQNNACREFKQTVTIDGRQESVASTACRGTDGKWVMIGH